MRELGKANRRGSICVLVILVVVLNLRGVVRCQDDAKSQDVAMGNPAAVQLLTELVYSRLTNLTAIFSDDILRRLNFCIKDVQAEWNAAFNFTSDLAFLSNCIRKTKGDLMQRLCTAAEIKFYFNTFFESGSKSTNYLKPNKNCNLTTWLPGCEPGWACSVGPNQKVDIKNSKDLPVRSQDCGVCCEGFFCPHGITCMIPCPLGSYCPQAKLNKTTGVCDPYTYQLPPGQPNHTCGGADVWADVGSTSEVFCSAGSYCPSTVKKVPCSSGYYCRTGSTSQIRCFRMTTCDPNSANQNITAYGIMLFAALSFLLLIMYNCSDQVLTTRERRQAKSREAAAKSARETAQARERWKSAKDVAKKHAIGLQTQLSRTFSRRKSTKQSGLLKILSKAKPGTEAALPPMVPDASQQSSATSKGKKKERSNLTKMMHAIEDDPESNEGFNLQIGDKNLKKNIPKGKQLHTHSQIFKYAYGQIEKEKALQEQHQNLTFSGVISMATDVEIEKRPTIEVAFKDLTLTLKGKKKHLLRCVTGKIMPGRVSAVMGPSGAGKTTFLSALAGKATGCTMSGTILINGKVESIHSYKKIIGFVPQDDIVHGNLTVEENLWFSARCRLSADLPKPEKVLVVERVIESLGLQAVRDSLVGTVEKRGISGGQRKRVNVGLEMVMEPSLLILDEPTSGLDSSSSQLLLRALRREALEGVNICTVVHQPSYTLFKMFDDLILLAKGGLTAYHGSVKKVEEYFSSLGIQVPERVNPPDYFIDILEGIAKPSTSSGVNYKQLPIRWMLHNGYPLPPDMLDEAAGLEGSAHGGNSTHGGNSSAGAPEEHSFAGDLWQDMKCTVELKRDNIQHNFSKSKDLSDRLTPGVYRQYRYFLGRVGKQRLRDARIQAVDYLILLLAGVCLGTLAKVSDETFGALGYTYTVIAVSLLCKIAALRSFSTDKLHYWRESGSGMSSLAYFLAKDTIDHFNTIIKPVVYLSMFYFFNNPRSTFTDNYIVLLCLVYCVTGMAYAFAILFEPGPAQLWSVLVPVVLTLVANHNNGNEFVKGLANVCYTKWALEAFVIANAERFDPITLSICGTLECG
ncbi:ABC transporter G family member 28-like isoform X2 [Malania oleifera]|uniref:ABC transporter G family member 28-like isoform X2 n=1 Tax=Malania oleifera TaxID=397392 RepID=UPI0025AEAE05|nr:ABC transporter G family member 28-like isoform X2 [Malania oleifera]